MPAFKATFFDGKSASSHAVKVTVLANGLDIRHLEDDVVQLWPLSELKAVSRHTPGNELRLKREGNHGARLVVPPGPHVEALFQAAPHLSGKFNGKQFTKRFAIIAACVGLLVLSAYALISLAPTKVAQVMPESWRERLANHTERSFLKSTTKCSNPKGQYALNRMASRIGLSAASPPDFSIRVFDLPVVNAFALPGGRIVMTRKLIETADRPAQVAGVLAHELGHVNYRHPEASFVRVMGLQLILAIATGGSGGNETLGSIAGLLTILSYSRSAEVEADKYATALMEKGGIDPLGLKEFFGKLKKIEDDKDLTTITKYARFLSTHPGTKERMEAIKPIAPEKIKPVLDEGLWRDLKAICK